MKRLFFIITAALALAISASAQDNKAEKDLSPLVYGTREPLENIVPGMKYKQLKGLYNPKEYTSTALDKTNPAVMGVASFFIPGLGQMISGEFGRGVAWLGGYLGCGIVGGIGTGMMAATMQTDANGEVTATGTTKAGSALVIAAAIGAITVNIISICDAVKVSKVRNMYEQDIRARYAVDLNLYPSVNAISTANGVQHTAGLTLAMRF